jgi:hypothetical protein
MLPGRTTMQPRLPERQGADQLPLSSSSHRDSGSSPSCRAGVALHPLAACTAGMILKLTPLYMPGAPKRNAYRATVTGIPALHLLPEPAGLSAWRHPRARASIAALLPGGPCRNCAAEVIDTVSGREILCSSSLIHVRALHQEAETSRRGASEIRREDMIGFSAAQAGQPCEARREQGVKRRPAGGRLFQDMEWPARTQPATSRFLPICSQSMTFQKAAT